MKIDNKECDYIYKTKEDLSLLIKKSRNNSSSNDSKTVTNHGTIEYDSMLLYKVIDDIYYDDDFKMNFSESVIKSSILHNLAKYINKKYDIDEIITYIIQTINNISEKEYLCMLPISGVTIYPSKNIQSYFVKIYQQEYIKGIIRAKTKKKYKFFSDLEINSNFISLDVKANNAEEAKSKSIIIGTHFINTLRILSSFYVIDWIDTKIDISLGDDSIVYNDAIVFNEESGMIFDSKNTKRVLINSDNLLNNDIQKKTLSVINKILKKLSCTNEDLSALEEAILVANNLIGGGLNSNVRTQKIVNYMSSIEAFLEDESTDAGRIKKRVTDRAAQMIWQQGDDLQKIKYNIKRLYELRSKVSHGESVHIGTYDVKLLLEYSRSIFIIMIYNFDIFDNDTSFKDEIKKFLNNKNKNTNQFTK